MKPRLAYLFLAIACFALCLLIATRLVDLRFIRGFTGDCLVVLLLFFLAKSVNDFATWKLALTVFLFACSIEGLQYLRAADRLALHGWPRIVLGATFDPLDILAYALGAAIACWSGARLSGRVFYTEGSSRKDPG